MTLNDRKHVEAVALIQTLLDSPLDPDVRGTCEAWCLENRPPTRAYLSAIQSLRDEALQQEQKEETGNG